MSSLAALFNFDGRPLDPADLARMAGALAPAGPHGQRQQRGQTWGMSFHLRRFTPEDRYEQQPLPGEQGRYWVLADARLDNRDELLRQFAIPPAEAAHTPDSRLILRAFQHWGESCPIHLIGDFAFLVWDSLARRLFAACDPMGRLTLLYHRTPNRLLVSTAYKGLHALPEVPRQLDQQRLADFLVTRPMPPGSTIYQGIERLPPAHCLSTDGKDWRQWRYWRLDPEAEIHLPNDDAYREAFLELYDRVIRAQLRAAGPVGVYMSGGLDSSSVGAMAARALRERGEKLTAFTMVHKRGFDPGVDTARIDPEYTYVEALRGMHANLDVVYVTGKDTGLLDGWEETFELIGVPANSLSNTRRIRAFQPEIETRGIAVMLNGNRGNRSISYTGADFLPRAFLSGQWLKVYHGVQALRPLSGSSLARSFLKHVLRPLLPVEMDSWQQSDGGRLSGLSTAFRSGNALEFKTSADWRKLMNPRLRYGETFLFDLIHNAMDEWVGLRAEIGIEDRDPTGDRRIVEFCTALPMHQFLRKGHNRYLIRHAMAGIVPDTIRQRAHFGPREADFGERVDEAMSEVASQLTQLESHPYLLDILDFAQLRALLELPTKERRKHSHKAFRRLLRGIQMGRFIHWAEGMNG